MEAPPEGKGETLQQLIARRKRALKLDYADMVRLATQSGYPISEPRWYHWAGDSTKWTGAPSVPVVLGIAATLQVSKGVVWEAIGVSYNIHIRTRELDPKTRIMVAAFEEVPDSDQDMVLDMVQAVINARRAGTEAQGRRENS